MRKYLEDIGVTDTPESWGKNDERQAEWAKERETYGFDERETWSMDFTFYLWLYEHLSMYLDSAAVDLDYHKFKYKKKKYTQKQMIYMCIQYLEEYFNNNNTSTDTTCEIGKIWVKILPCMWW